MSVNIDVEQTALAIDSAALRIRQAANELDRIAQKMRDKNDLSYVAEALTEIINIPQSVRLDLFVTRPIRELTKNA